MPIAIGWIFRVLARAGKGFAFPLAAAALAWLIEQLTGAVSWAIFALGQSFLELVMDAIDSIDLGTPPDWLVFGQTFVNLVGLSGIVPAFGIILSSAILRLVVKAITLGRF